MMNSTRRILTLLLLFICLLAGHTIAFQALPVKTVVVRTLVRRTLPRPINTVSVFDVRTNTLVVKLGTSNVNGIDSREDSAKLTFKNGYNGLVKLYLILSVFQLLLFGKTNHTLSKGAGLILAAGFAHILSDATDHDRLGSDTYKRMNLGLMTFNLMSLLTTLLPGEVRLFQSLLPAWGPAHFSMSIICRIIGTALAFKGWQRGLGDKGVHALNELKEGILSTITSIWVSRGRGVAYRNALLSIQVSLILFARQRMATITTLNNQSLAISHYGTGIAHLSLVATALYSLKDAGERDRLKGTTFIQLNNLVGIWLILCKLGIGTRVASRMGIATFGLIQLTPTTGGLDSVVQFSTKMLPASSLLLLSGIAFSMKGYLLQREKEGKLEYSSVKGRWILVRENS